MPRCCQFTAGMSQVCTPTAACGRQLEGSATVPPVHASRCCRAAQRQSRGACAQLAADSCAQPHARPLPSMLLVMPWCTSGTRHAVPLQKGVIE